MLIFPRETAEYLPVPVEGPGALTGLPVEMQIRPYPLRPTSDGWKTASWGTIGAETVAQIPIGPGSDFDFSTAPGDYVPYVRITSAPPETPVIEGSPFKIS
ncbi:hypothetical protein ACIBEJ_34995 [Nonomuraea sp. NPDC050790]|uniref:hypothetical protein n=1 Tax=Nonomuraea sp. NPDC050790 TaxID=3364371 RepID=UPI0037A29226